MKKIICVVLILMLPVMALADGIDLSSMTYDQLITLRKSLTEEIMNRPEWKEVTIPAGDWNIGSDIPAGTYSITPTKYTLILIWEHGIDSGLVFNRLLDKGESYGKITLKEGWIMQVSDPIILAPPISPGF